jgi:hypothetical protein
MLLILSSFQWFLYMQWGTSTVCHFGIPLLRNLSDDRKKESKLCICRSANLQRLRSPTRVGDFILTLLQVQEASIEEENIPTAEGGNAVDALLAILNSIRPCGR